MARYYITENGKTRKVDIERGTPLLPKLMFGIVVLYMLGYFLKNPSEIPFVGDSWNQPDSFRSQKECVDYVSARFTHVDDIEVNEQCSAIMVQGGKFK